MSWLQRKRVGQAGNRASKSQRTNMYKDREHRWAIASAVEAEGAGWKVSTKGNADKKSLPKKAIRGFGWRSSIGFEFQKLRSVLH